MNDQTHSPQDDELEGFDTFEDDSAIEDQALSDEPIDDADFQDISDDVDADVFGETEPAPVAKKKTSWFNIGIAVVAIVVAGGLVFMKLGPTLMGGSSGGGDAPITMPVAVTPQNNDAGNSNAQAAAQAALAPNGKFNTAGKTPGLLDSPDQYANLGTPNGPTPVQAAVVQAPADPFAGVPNKPGAGLPAPSLSPAPTMDTGQAPMPAPISAAPSLVPANNAASVTETKTTVTTSVPSPTTMPVPTMPSSAGANPALESKVSSLESRLDEMDSKLNAIQQAPAANDGRLNTIQTTLERLESRLDDMASRKTSVREASAPAPTPMVDNDYSNPAPAKAKTVARKAKAKKTQSSQWDKPYKPSSATQVSTGSSGWELRGATPGRATVARGSDIREIGVGETIPGLGEITGVAQINGRWVVQGTQGRLGQ